MIVSDFIVGSQCGCPGHYWIPLLSQYVPDTISALPYVTWRQSSLPVPGPFKCSIIKNGTNSPKVSCTAWRTGERHGGEKGALGRSSSKRGRSHEDRRICGKRWPVSRMRFKRRSSPTSWSQRRSLMPNQQQRFFDLMRQSMVQAKNSGLPTTTSGGK